MIRTSASLFLRGTLFSVVTLAGISKFNNGVESEMHKVSLDVNKIYENNIKGPDCYNLAAMFQVFNTRWGLKLVNDNTMENDKTIVISLPLLTEANKGKIKQTKYTIDKGLITSYQVDLNGGISLPVGRDDGNNKEEETMILNALSYAATYESMLTNKDKEEKKYDIKIESLNIDRLNGGYPTDVLYSLLSEQIKLNQIALPFNMTNNDVEKYKKHFKKDLKIFGKFNGSVIMGIAVNGTTGNYKDKVNGTTPNHAISIESVDLDTNGEISNIKISDPNNTDNFIDIDFEELYKLVYFYHIGTLKTLDNSYINKIVEKIEPNFSKTKGYEQYNSYIKGDNTLGQKIINSGKEKPDLSNERGDLTVLFNLYSTEKDEFSLQVRSYNQKNNFIAKDNNNTVNSKFSINGIEQEFNFIRYKKEIFVENNITDIIENNETDKICSLETGLAKNYCISENKKKTQKVTYKDADNYLNAEITANLINFILYKYIIPQYGNNLSPFSLKNNTIGFDYKSRENDGRNGVEDFFGNGIDILSNINILKLKTDKDKQNFVKFLNDLYEAEYNKQVKEKRIKFYQNILNNYIKTQNGDSTKPFSIDFGGNLNFDYKSQKDDGKSWIDTLGGINIGNIKYLEFKTDEEVEEFINFLNFMYKDYGNKKI